MFLRKSQRAAATSRHRPCLWFLLGLAAFVPVNAAAVNESSLLEDTAHAVMLAAREAHPGATVEVEMVPLDPRVQLKSCEEVDTQITGNKLYGRVSVNVRCLAPAVWGIFLTARVTVTQPVVTTTAPIPRNSILQATDLALVPRKLATLRPGYLLNLEDAVNMTSRQGLRADSVVYQRQLAARKLVNRGDLVTVSATFDQVTVTSQGVALADGVYGSRINVKNTRSERTISAWVVGFGKVSTNPGD